LPGLIGRWFVSTMEPPVKAPFRMKAPRIVAPRSAPPLANAFTSFLTSQDEARAFSSSMQPWTSAVDAAEGSTRIEPRLVHGLHTRGERRALRPVRSGNW